MADPDAIHQDSGSALMPRASRGSVFFTRSVTFDHRGAVFLFNDVRDIFYHGAFQQSATKFFMTFCRVSPARPRLECRPRREACPGGPGWQLCPRRPLALRLGGRSHSPHALRLWCRMPGGLPSVPDASRCALHSPVVEFVIRARSIFIFFPAR